MSLSSVLLQKIDQAKMVIEEALDTYGPEHSLLAWSAGKDSTLLLRLILEVYEKQQIPKPRALDIDQDDQFDVLIDFRDRIAKEWEVDLLIVKNSNFLDKAQSIGDEVEVATLDKDNRVALSDIRYDKPFLAWVPDSPECNHLLKTIPVNQALIDYEIKALFTGIRWDEHGAREQETYMSPRDHPPHTRIHPLLHFTERDIWDVTFGLDIPFNGLYQQGYRSIGSKTGTKKPAEIPAWEQDLENTKERDGRSVEKEKMMAQLRALGYM